MNGTNRLTVSHPWDTGSLKASSEELVMQCQWTQCSWVPCLNITLRMQLMLPGVKMMTYLMTVNLKNHTLTL